MQASGRSSALLCCTLLFAVSCQNEDKGVVTVRVDAPPGATVTFSSPCSGEAVRGNAADLLRGTPVEILIENWGADGLASVFDHWEGDVPTMDIYTNPLRLDVDNDLSLTAVNASGWTTESAADDFQITEPTGVAPLDVAFDASGACWEGGCPEDGGLWWSFGDGSSSKDLAPVHRFEVPGVYSVTLRPQSALDGPPPVTLHDAVVVHHEQLGSPYWYQCREFDRGLLMNLPLEEAMAHDVLDEMNQIRKKAGKKAFTWEPSAAQAARAEIEDRLRRGWTGDVSPEGWGLEERLEKMLGLAWSEPALAEAQGPATPWDIADEVHSPSVAALGAGRAGVGVLVGDQGLAEYVIIIAYDGGEEGVR